MAGIRLRAWDGSRTPLPACLDVAETAACLGAAEERKVLRGRGQVSGLTRPGGLCRGDSARGELGPRTRGESSDITGKKSSCGQLQPQTVAESNHKTTHPKNNAFLRKQSYLVFLQSYLSQSYLDFRPTSVEPRLQSYLCGSWRLVAWIPTRKTAMAGICGRSKARAHRLLCYCRWPSSLGRRGIRGFG